MFADKVVIVTGASSGIGKSLAFELAKHGCYVVLASRNLIELEKVKNEIKSICNREALVVQTDVSIEEDCRQLIEKTIEKYGKIDILINNAGVSMRALFENLQLKVFKQVIDTNFFGTVYCTKYALPHLIESKGCVVGVISTAGFRGLPGRSAYTAAKFAINGFLETLRTENRNKGLNVLIALPGFVESNIRVKALLADGSLQGVSPREEKKMMTSDEVARLIVRAIKRKKLYLVTDLQGKLIRILNIFFPKWIDKKVLQHFAKEPGSPL